MVTSTNNAAVDHALAPFLRGPELPVALRLGNRHTLADETAPALARAIEALRAPGQKTLASLLAGALPSSISRYAHDDGARTLLP